MGTKFNEIYDLFMMLIKDYNLIQLYNLSTLDFETYLQGWLVLSISDFSDCRQNLEDRNDDEGEFNFIMDSKVKTILAQLMVKYWMNKEVQDILQMNLHVQDKDFKVFAEGANLREKTAHLDRLKETASQAIMDYKIGKIDWQAWSVGNFLGG